MHGGLFIVILVDFIVNNIQFYRNHIYIVMITAVLYLGVNCFYTLTVHTIYPMITYENIITYITLGLSFALCIISFIIGHLIFTKIKQPKIKK